MPKNIVSDLTLDQKIDLLFSKNLFKDLNMNDYHFQDLVGMGKYGDELTGLLSQETNRENLELIHSLTNELIKEVNSRKKNVILTPFIIPKINNKGYNKELVEQYISTFHKHNIFVMGVLTEDLVNEKSNTTLIYDTLNLIVSCKIDGIIINKNSSFGHILRNELKFKGLILMKSNDASNQLAYTLFSDITNKYTNRTDLENAINKQSILNEKAIDAEINRFFQFIGYINPSVKIEKRGKQNTTMPNVKILSDNNIVLLKNENNLLPLANNVSLALFGGNDLTVDQEMEIQYEIAKYFPNFIDYYKGYEISDSVDANVVIINFNSKTNNNISTLQVKLVSDLYYAGKRIIAILPPSITYIDSELHNKCSVIFIGKIFDSQSMKPLINIMIGKDEPTGKISQNIYHNDNSILYPTGFGLDSTSSSKAINQKTATSKSKPINWKLIFMLMFTISVDIAIYVIYTLYINKDYLIGFIIFMAIVNILFIKLIIDSIKRKGKKNIIAKKDSEDVLEDDFDDQYEEEVTFEPEYDESGNLIQILKPNEMLSVDAIYNAKIEMDKYCELLCQYMLDNGLKIEKKVAREIFSCMAASQIIIVKSERNIISQRFIEIFSDFIGARSYFGTEKPEWKSFRDLYQNDTKLEKCIRSAHRNKNLIHIMSYNKVNLFTIENYFSKIINFAKNPLLPCSIEEMKVKDIKELPKNIWFMVIPTSINVSIPKKLMEYSFIIDTGAKIVTPKDVVRRNALKTSYYYFTDIVRDYSDTFYISEEVWKKIDQIELYVNKQVPFNIENRIFRQLERYTTMYMMCGGDEIEAIDTILATKLLILIAKLDLVKNGEYEGFLDLCEKLFGLENLTKSKLLLQNVEKINN